MTLKDFLKINNISSKEFSEKINVSEISISRYINNSRFPNKKILKRIFDFTSGLVTSDDFMKKRKNNHSLSKSEKIEMEVLANNIKVGDRRALARGITIVESSLEKDQYKTDYLLSKL